MSKFRGGDANINRDGRPKGSKNKNTQEVREAYQRLVEGNLENMSQWIQAVDAEDPAKAFDLMVKLSDFVIPKLARTELTGANGDDLFKDMKFEFGPSVAARLDSLEGLEDIEIDE